MPTFGCPCRPEHIQAAKNQFVSISAAQKVGAGASSGGGVIPGHISAAKDTFTTGSDFEKSVVSSGGGVVPDHVVNAKQQGLQQLSPRRL